MPGWSPFPLPYALTQKRFKKFFVACAPKNFPAPQNPKTGTMEESRLWMNNFRQYRFARIEGQGITEADLDAQFKDGIQNLQEVEHASNNS